MDVHTELLDHTDYGAATNDNNNAISIPPTVVVTADHSCPNQRFEDEGDRNDNCHVASSESLIPGDSRVQKLIIESLDSNVSDSDFSTGYSDNDTATMSSVSEDFVEPSEEITRKVIDQVEFYFSDANILKDAFLLKHVRRNKEGYVSLKLITSFKKMKPLSKDYRVVAHCLKQSKKLIVNEEKMKVRRVDPLPEYDETTPSRTVVVMNIPIENPTVEAIADIFAKCGEISLIRILRPGKPIPQDIRKYADKHHEIGSTLCAVVEFENHQFALEACKKLSDTNNWREGMRVVLLAASKHKESKASGTQDKNKKNLVRKKKGKQFTKLEQANNLYSSGSESDISQLDSCNRSESSGHTHTAESADGMPNHRRRNFYGKSKLTVSNENISRAASNIGNAGPRGTTSKDNQSGDSSPASSPWVRRRLKANDLRSRSENNSPRVSPSLSRRFANSTDGVSAPRMLDMSGVLRQPHGPDGSSGFSVGRGRGKNKSSS